MHIPNSDLNSSIRLLDDAVINQIAAGEVVERPSHLLKELLENSVDALASEIDVEIADGGRWLEVADNGKGIPPSELPLTVLRHATSKISQAEDLWSLQTYGFRGEALASAAAISKLTVTSRVDKEATASQLIVHFGKQVEPVLDLVPRRVGTTVRVEELFASTPARRKFLKSDSAEVTHLRSLLRAFALSRPEISIRLRIGGALSEVWTAETSRLSRARQIMEEPDLFECQRDFGQISVKAVFSSPHRAQKTSRAIWIFVQNRWIQDRALQTAILEAYRSLLMQGQYPTAAVWIELPPDQVDINVHPNKSSVRFADSGAVFRAVYHCLRGALEKAPWMVSAGDGNQSTRLENFPEDVAWSSSTSSASEKPSYECGPAISGKLSGLMPSENVSFSRRDPEQLAWSEDASLQRYQSRNSVVEKMPFAGTSEVATEFANSEKELSDSSLVQLPVHSEAASTTEAKAKWSQLQVLTQAHQTYMVCENKQGLVLVDQHAAHERVLFERLWRSWQQGKFEVQVLLFPFQVELSSQQVELWMQQAPALEKLGIRIEQLGPATLGVLEHPTWVKESALRKVLEVGGQEMEEMGASFELASRATDWLATLACHSAVRAGQVLTRVEMQNLLLSMDEFPLSSYCPHGRPVAVDWNWAQVERDFGRRV